VKRSKKCRELAQPPYEDYRVLVPCKLVDRGKHEIVIRLQPNNYVQFQNGCDKKIAEAAEILGQVTTCKLAIDLLRAEIRGKQAGSISLCQRCNLVVTYASLLSCPFCKATTRAAPFWDRIVRDGRLRRVSQPR
jgi:hypothetical protein